MEYPTITYNCLTQIFRLQQNIQKKYSTPGRWVLKILRLTWTFSLTEASTYRTCLETFPVDQRPEVATTRCTIFVLIFGSKMYNASNLCSRIQWIYTRSSHKKKTLSVRSHFISHTSAKPESCLCQLSHFLTIQSQKLETHLDVIPAMTKIGSNRPTRLQDRCHQCFNFRKNCPFWENKSQLLW